MKGSEVRESEGNGGRRLLEIEWEDKERGGCYREGSDGEIGRRNIENFLIYVIKEAHSPSAQRYN